jgi:DNA-binding beta-propeller fold protein YncE
MKKSVILTLVNIFKWLLPYGVRVKKMNIDYMSLFFTPNAYRIFFKFTFIFSFFLSSCQKEPVETIYFDFTGNSGVYIINEGNFMFGNASLSFLELDHKRNYQNIFSSRNKVPLGDVAQSMKIYNGKIWMVINNSGKIYVADENTLEFRGSITGLNSPRYIEFISDHKAYVSDLYSESIHIIHPKTFEKIGEIDLRGGNKNRSAEQMIQKGDTVFTHCWNNGNEILLINSQSDELMGALEVGGQPQSIALDAHNKLWVLCDGGYDGHPYFWEKPELIRIDTRTLEIEKKFFFDINTSPSELHIQNDTLYFINQNIYRMSVLDAQLPQQAFIKSPYADDYGGFYSLGIHPQTSEMYVADAIDHQQNGIIYQYNSKGELVNSFKSGVNPGYFCFKIK